LLSDGVQPPRVRLDELSAELGQDRVLARGNLELAVREPSASRFTELTGELSLADLRRRWPAGAPLALDVAFNGAGPIGAPELDLGASWRPLERQVYEGGATLGEGSALGSWRDGQFTVEELTQALGIAELRARGVFDPGQGERPWAARVERFELRRSAGGEVGEPLLALSEPVALDAALVAGERPGALTLDGVAGTLTVGREPERWRMDAARLDLDLVPAELLPEGLRLGSLDGRIEWRDGDQARLEADLRAGAARLSVGEGALVAEGLLLDVDLGLPSLAGGAFDGTVRASLLGLDTTDLWPADRALAPGRADLALRYGPGGVAVERAAVELPNRLWTTLAGSFAPDRRGFPATLELSGRGELQSLGFAARALGELRLAEGRIDLDTLTVDGPVTAPRVGGDGRLADGALRLEGNFPPIRGLQGPFRIEDNRLLIEEWLGQAGSAPLALSGEQRFAGEWDTDLFLSGSNTLLYRDSRMILRGDLDLRLAGARLGRRLTGEVQLRNSRYRRDLDLLGVGGFRPRPTSSARAPIFSVGVEPLASTVLDVAVRNAEDDPFRLQTNVLTGTLRPDLTLLGTLGAPRVSGTVVTDPTRLTLADSTVRMPSGLVRFDPSDPESPTVDLRGEARIHSYDVSVAVRGRYDDPTVDVKTVPPLSTDAALALLLVGSLPGVGPQGGIQTDERLELYVSRNLGSQVFGTAGESNESLLARFEAEIGRDISRGGRPTVAVAFRAVDGVLLDRDSLYLTGERDRYEDVNGGLRLLFRFK
ncbi:MAG: translocation/assembly module TamB domain-containing protein, partial [Planctomycetota bacterium]